MRWLVRWTYCDRAFWQDERAAPLPEHSAWERQAAAHRESGAFCEGAGATGYWIGEGDGPIGGRPREGSEQLGKGGRRS
ncbi:MAG: hypothetical protein ACRDIE_24340 [Chloroflexota bacterium]